jgi:beta-glucosidase
MSFSKDFLWGVSTASYQIEGAAREDGKGLSVWDDFTSRPGSVIDGSSGDVACDHYHRYRQDIDLMREMGINAYRFSISWPRIIPNGTGEINQKGIAFYSNLIDELLKASIKPMVTLFHWDYPYELYKRGSWLNPDSPKWFAEYALCVARAFKDRVGDIITFNEPQCFLGLGYMDGIMAPGVKESNRSILQMSHNILLAHGLAVQALRSESSRMRVSYAPCSCTVPCPATDTEMDAAAAKKAYFMPRDRVRELVDGVSWWSDPVFFGEYPKEAVARHEAIMPKIGPDDMKLISQPIDYYCQNIYHGHRVKANGCGGYEKIKAAAGAGMASNGFAKTPECLYWGVKMLHERYNIPIVISENGMASADSLCLDGAVHDQNRIDFIQRYLLELNRAIDEGIPVKGYCLWTLIDNFEWHKGYTDRFGLIYVDYQTQKRVIKDSGYYYGECAKSNGESLFVGL